MTKGEVLISEEEIAKRVKELGEQITGDYKGKSILLVGILKGSTPFLADLMRRIDLDVEIDFMIVSSYGGGTSTSGDVKILKDLECDIKGRDVLIVEDIIDSGVTLNALTKLLRKREPASLKVVSMLDKPSRRQVDFYPDYCGFEVEDKFIVGYGLDFDQKYRQLPYISWLKQE